MRYDLRLDRLRYEVRGFARQYPTLYMPYIRWRCRSLSGAQVIDKNTEIVIDGFPRSANSFAWAAFTSAQDGPVQIAHHIHAPCQITFGVKFGIPVVLLVRDPDDAVLSIKIMQDYLDVSQIIRNYVRFYKCLLPYRDRVIVADFATVTTNFGRIIQAVNDQFGTSFLQFANNEENIRICFDLVDNHWQKGEMRDRTPSAYRNELKESIRHFIENPRLAGLRSDAKALYRSFVPD